MNFKIGEINTLEVLRKSDLGYMLINKMDEEVLLHFNQATRELNNGETVEVFVFLDSKKRLTATMETPFIKVNEPGFVKVVNVIENLGVFVNINIAKDILISSDDLPLLFDRWPVVGDTVLCKLKATATQLIGKLVSAEDAKSLLKPTRTLAKFEVVNAIVLKSGAEGVNLITLEGHSIFVYYKHTRRDYRIGEEVSVTINNVREGHNYNGTLLEKKVALMKQDADVIMDFLNDYDGFMPYTAKSNVDDIEKTFKMSKAAFKRALGTLYKKRLIEFKEDGTYIVK